MEYAVRALVTLAGDGGAGKVRHAAELAKVSGTPAKFLEQVLRLLRRGGFVKSQRGAGGGYILAQPAEKIKLDAVMSWMEGEEDRGVARGDILGEEWARIKGEAEAAGRKVFAGESLAKLAERVQARRLARGRGNEYQI